MNKFKKYCPNVWVAECEEQHEKGEIIALETKYGKEVECEVYNLVGYTGTKEKPNYCYSIVKLEDKTYAERKAEKYNNAATNSIGKSNERWKASQEGAEFLSLAEPIKVGHHSEKRHRALIERNSNRMDKAMEHQRKAEEQKRKAEYWESRANNITLAMPESIEYFEHKLELAKAKQQGLKDGTIKKEHSYSLPYATKEVKELTKKYETAKVLWE
jgi:hypothetical protein